jgi:SAM-dependent methyltransferase
MLADGGPVRAGAATRLVDDLHRMRELGGRRFHDAPGEFFIAARTEAASRVGRVSALQIQSEEHHYLEAIPRDAPLRADVLWFLDGLPQQLGRTLELGAGYGRLAQELSPRAARYVCVDLDPGMMRDLSRAARQYGLVADIHALPFASGQFETIVANNVLEHAYDPVRAFSEIKRVLAAGGELHALIPLDALNTRHRLPAHLWKADLENIPAAARMAGLAVEACDPINIYSLAVAGSFPSCDGWICRLRARAVQKES